MMIELRVIMVPAQDLDNPERLHTSYTVQDMSAGGLRASAGWTLRDAIEYFASDYGVQRDGLSVARPFMPQEIYLRRSGVRM